MVFPCAKIAGGVVASKSGRHMDVTIDPAASEAAKGVAHGDRTAASHGDTPRSTAHHSERQAGMTGRRDRGRVIEHCKVLSLAFTLFFASIHPAHANDRDDALDRFMITEVMYKYAIMHNASDIEGYADLFTDDAIIYDDTMHYEFARGRSNIIAAAKSDRDHYNPEAKNGDAQVHLGKLRHNITNPVVKLNGDGTASGICYVQIVANQPGVGPAVLSQGYYRDQYVKKAGKWLISRRDIYALEMSNWGLADKLNLKNGPGPAGKN